MNEQTTSYRGTDLQPPMKNLVFFDTETTGDASPNGHDHLIQIAYSFDGAPIQNHLFKPKYPSSYEAMAVHHITHKMVEDRPPFYGSEPFNRLLDTVVDNDSIFIAHNIQFDALVLKQEGIEIPVKKQVCTLKIARYLDPEALLPHYSLQYLRYRLDLNIEATAHDAEGDVLVLMALFNRLFAKIVEQKKEIPFLTSDDVIEEMVAISNRPSLIKKFRFGKYKGQLLEKVLISDRRYITWLLGAEEQKEKEMQDKDLVYSLKYYLGMMV